MQFHPKPRLIFLSVLSLILFSTKAFAQNNGVNVNPSTGAISVNIPLYNVTKGQLSIPVSLSYNTTGKKPKDIQGTAGFGWSIAAGGAITREVNGIPDDLGWMNSAMPNNISGFNIANTSNVCSDELTDISYNQWIFITRIQ